MHTTAALRFRETVITPPLSDGSPISRSRLQRSNPGRECGQLTSYEKYLVVGSDSLFPGTSCGSNSIPRTLVMPLRAWQRHAAFAPELSWTSFRSTHNEHFSRKTHPTVSRIFTERF